MAEIEGGMAYVNPVKVIESPDSYRIFLPEDLEELFGEPTPRRDIRYNYAESADHPLMSAIGRNLQRLERQVSGRLPLQILHELVAVII